MESMLVIILMEKFFLRENLKMENSTGFGQNIMKMDLFIGT